MRKINNLLATTAVLAFGAVVAVQPAAAQTSTTTTTTTVVAPADLVVLDDDAAVVAAYGLSVVELEDLDVVNPSGEEIGEVEEVLADASGTPVAVAVDFDDGFLGVGDTEAVVMLDMLTLQGEDLVSPITAEQAQALPQWDD